MGLLTDKWDALNYSEDTLNRDKEEFRMLMHRVVGVDYPWLASELYAIEGELGWGPGFRDFEDRFFLMPPETPAARSRMKNFVRTIEMSRPDKAIKNVILEAVVHNEPTTRKARMLRKYLCHATPINKNSLVHKVYGCVLNRHFPKTYVVGAARIYRAIWDMQKIFTLAIAGLIHLYYEPLTKLKAAVETSLRHKKANDLSRWESNTGTEELVQALEGNLTA